jgi:hypothetical protein
MPHGILHVFNTIIYKKEFQNPQIFQQTIRLFPKQSTLVGQLYGVPHWIIRVFNTILYENEFQNPQILIDTLEITKSCFWL